MKKKSDPENITGKYDFHYTARNAKRKKVKGELLAESINDARNTLRAQGFREIKVKRMKEPSAITKFLSRKKVKAIDITIFTRQIATMQQAGLPLVQGLQVVLDSSSKPAVTELITSIKNEVESGGSFSECLRFHPRDFDDLYCNLVEAGETSGNLDVMLLRIASYREKTESLKRKLKKAMYYPITIMLVAFAVTTLLLVKVIPTFKSLFEGFGAQLPAFTLFVLNISDTVRNNGFKVTGTIFTMAWIFVKLYRVNANFKNMLQRALLRLPIFGKIFREAAVARFARTLATTFSAGVPLPESLTLVAKASGNIVYYNAIMKMRDSVTAGSRINTSMRDTKVFPSMVVQMVAIGEETGSLDSMLTKVAVIYEEEVDSAVDSLSSLLEPLIMVILGVIVGGLVIAMYLPIFKMGSVI